MNDWWDERLYPDCRQSFAIKEVLYDERSSFQHVQVLDTLRFGRMLALDGIVQTTEADEFIYHEMLVHPAMSRHNNPIRAAIIGGGDGGAARELLRWPSIGRLDLIEIDADVIDVSRRFLASISQRVFEDDRLVVHVEDGVQFVKSAKGEYDVIVLDSSDPVGPATDLFSSNFYTDCANSLKPDGALVAQCGAPLLAPAQLRSAYAALSSCFRHVAVYLAAIPTYYGGSFAFLLATDSCKVFAQGVSGKLTSKPLLGTRHFNRSVNENLLTMPVWQSSMLEGVRPSCKQCKF
jgi:spermidine synthase